ncbi:DNA repair and recombination protein [Colletotrichum truncatum]|uniref:DNA repair and recombination protein n=1 Tax=Colletotrichum truncatum TaxID=5467 RepID=A0ACC3YMZ0_COLTU|nr:DNA repair and recombination protein [Colletotrichum truncatum]KAF6782878.1 DNA repair and recombination protein [Colletotrichum truncatum]
MQSTSPDPGDIWERLYTDMPGRVKAVVNNIQLLHKSAEDAKKDAKLWASRSEGDEGYEFDVPEEGLDLSEEWHPDRIDLRHTFHDVVFSLQDGPGVTNGSPGIKELLQTLDNAGFSSIDDDSRIQSTNSQLHIQTTLPKQHLKITKAAQERLHKERMLAIEGDESAERPLHTGAETGFGDNDANIDFPAQPAIVGLKPASNWIAITAANTFTQAGKIIGAERTLNRMQGIALSLICEALDERTNGADRQHLQYVGGGGGTGKSWLIDTVKEVFAAKGASSRLVITATSGTAAAGIGGNTIHSAVGLAFRDADGATVEPMLSNNLEKAKERWRRRDALIIDEASMLGLQTLYDIDQKLRMLRGFPEKPFGGISVVVFTGDFLQFPPVLQKSLLSTTERISIVLGNIGPGSKAIERRWKEAKAKELWQGFTNVVVLDEQKRAEGDAYLLGFLKRLREGKQTREDAAKLEAQYNSESKFDFTSGRRAVIPLNRHRWDLTLHAALAYSVDTGRKISIYLSKHKWESRIPTAEERKAAMLLGDEGKLSAAGMFPYVEGMPVVINENKYMGLKVVNGAEFTAVGILHPPGVEEIIINDRLSIFLGPPSGIILQSEETNGLAFPHLPPNTVMLPAANIRVPEKHIKILRPDLQKANVKLALVRTGLPCTPGFALTDFKAQGQTLEKTLLGLYGRTVGKNTGELERCDAVSMYVQLSRVRRFEDIALIQPLNVKQFLEARMPEELVEGTKRLRILAEATVRAFEARERDEA